MNKGNCALKLVDEIILYYDARSKKHQIDGKISPMSTSSTTNLTWTGLGANPGMHGERQASHCLSYFKAKFNMHCTQVLSAYRAVNTLHLGYTNQSINSVDGNNFTFFVDITPNM